GVSIISDIDDTVKVTEIRDGPAMVIMNTFFREFEATEGMQPLYTASWPGAPFHYVSGGPWQLYTPIAGFLSDARFPEGSLHMRDFPLHPFNEASWNDLPDQILNPSATFEHKVREISTLMKRFPARQFVLIGDSGESDPEIYREIQRQLGPQVLKIIIRDVAGEPERLKGMEVIEVE
ncbi:MAG: DUF2183 domain-containing protein, partial [Verrucomicrobiaceae bacterium]|nr:DUF2183 domain-containing protein [Verrucomicrobiaceae bacterium]